MGLCASCTTTISSSTSSVKGQDKITTSLATHLLSHHKSTSLLQHILSFHSSPNPKDYINLRSSSKLFHRALPQPPPLWTSFPHSNHTTLQSLVDRLEELHSSPHSGNVPSVLFIEEGEYGCGKTARWGDYIRVNKPLSIYGAGRRKTTLVGVGLMIKGNKITSQGIVEIEDLTIKGGEWSGLCANEGMNVIIKNVSVEKCQMNGVFACRADISCNDLQVIGCGSSGVYASHGATITLSGQGTSIQGNGTNGKSSSHGLKAGRSSEIKLVHPLTKEEISTNNGGGRNCGCIGDGTIE